MWISHRKQKSRNCGLCVVYIQKDGYYSPIRAAKTLKNARAKNYLNKLYDMQAPPSNTLYNREIKLDVTPNGKRQKWNFCRLSLALWTVEWKYL